jgi:site-specific recombinase XerD
LLYGTGCRIGELAILKVEDFSFEEGTVRLFGKGQKERIVPFNVKVGEALMLYLKSGQTGYLFRPLRNDAGKHMTTRSLARKLALACLRAGMPPVNPHRLRHAYATHLLNRGMNIRYVQELLGHTNLSTTQIYTHVAVANLAKQIARFHPREAGPEEQNNG